MASEIGCHEVQAESRPFWSIPARKTRKIHHREQPVGNLHRHAVGTPPRDPNPQREGLPDAVQRCLARVLDDKRSITPVGVACYVNSLGKDVSHRRARLGIAGCVHVVSILEKILESTEISLLTFRVWEDRI